MGARERVKIHVYIITHGEPAALARGSVMERFKCSGKRTSSGGLKSIGLRFKIYTSVPEIQPQVQEIICTFM